MSWQPIATAPTDGTRVLVREINTIDGSLEWVGIAAFERADFGGMPTWLAYEPDGRNRLRHGDGTVGWDVQIYPTEWQPLL